MEGLDLRVQPRSMLAKNRVMRRFSGIGSPGTTRSYVPNPPVLNTMLNQLTCHRSQTCTLDVLMHLPRSVFSQRQFDLFLWLLRVNDVDDVPSVRSMLGLNAALQRSCGIDSIAYKGALGHTYYVNALDQIIAQVCYAFFPILSTLIHL